MTTKPKTVLELFEGHPERWVKGSEARSEYGHMCRPTHKAAVCWCLVGALSFVYRNEVEHWQAMRRVFQFVKSIRTWNDDSNRTFDELLDLVRRAGV
jgi:hypothetical protein